MRKPPIIILAVVAVLLGFAWNRGWLGALTDPQAIQAAVAQAGMWGPLLFIALAIAFFALFFMSGPVWAATALWPVPLAFVYSFVAALLASLITYAVAYHLGRNWTQERVPASIRRWEERLRAQPFWTIFALRMLLWANPLIDLFAAVARVPPRTYVLATVIGLVPTTAFQISLGAGGIAIAGRLPWWGSGLLVAAVLAGIVAFRRRR